jgi:hypothetical protein
VLAGDKVGEGETRHKAQHDEPRGQRRGDRDDHNDEHNQKASEPRHVARIKEVAGGPHGKPADQSGGEGAHDGQQYQSADPWTRVACNARSELVLPFLPTLRAVCQRAPRDHATTWSLIWCHRGGGVVPGQRSQSGGRASQAGQGGVRRYVPAALPNRGDGAGAGAGFAGTWRREARRGLRRAGGGGGEGGLHY